jgi:hypothetical protein
MDRQIIVQKNQSAQGFLKWAVIDAVTKEVIRDSGEGWIPNLILNNGLNAIYSRYWCNCFEYAIAGTGTTPTSEDSDTVNASQSGTAVTADGAFFDSGDVGNVIKWDSGEEAMITAYSGPTQVTVSASQTVASGPFTMYNTNQTQLANELKRTNTYLTGAPNCQTTNTGTEFQNRRTFDFTAESGTVNYTEIGFSWANSGSNTTFSRILLPAPVQVLSGQQLRVVYELRVSYGPTTPQPKEAIVNGWPIAPATTTDGDECVQMPSLSSINSSTGQTSVAALLGNEPAFISDANSGSCYMFLSNDSTPINSAGSAPNRQGTSPAIKALAKAAYVTNSFYVDKSCTFAVGEANSTGWRSMGYADCSPNNTFPYSTNRTAFVFVFDEAQTKPNTHTLTLTWRTTWSRTLS